MKFKSRDFPQLKSLLEKLVGKKVHITVDEKTSKSGVVEEVIFKTFNIKMMLLEADGVTRAFDFLFPFEYEVSRGCLLLNYCFEKIKTLTNYDVVIELAQQQELPHKLYQNVIKIQIGGRS